MTTFPHDVLEAIINRILKKSFKFSSTFVLHGKFSILTEEGLRLYGTFEHGKLLPKKDT